MLKRNDLFSPRPSSGFGFETGLALTFLLTASRVLLSCHTQFYVPWKSHQEKFFIDTHFEGGQAFSVYVPEVTACTLLSTEL